MKHPSRHSGEGRNPAFMHNSEILDSGSSPE
jgi:predicted glutamine amidotransferase